jgi:hypothetical protein
VLAYPTLSSESQKRKKENKLKNVVLDAKMTGACSSCYQSLLSWDFAFFSSLGSYLWGPRRQWLTAKLRGRCMGSAHQLHILGEDAAVSDQPWAGPHTSLSIKKEYSIVQSWHDPPPLIYKGKGRKLHVPILPWPPTSLSIKEVGEALHNPAVGCPPLLLVHKGETFHGPVLSWPPLLIYKGEHSMVQLVDITLSY